MISLWEATEKLLFGTTHKAVLVIMVESHSSLQLMHTVSPAPLVH